MRSSFPVCGFEVTGTEFHQSRQFAFVYNMSFTLLKCFCFAVRMAVFARGINPPRNRDCALIFAPDVATNSVFVDLAIGENSFNQSSINSAPWRLWVITSLQ